MVAPAPAGPKARFLAGHLLELRADQLGFLAATARAYGDVALVRYGPRPVYLLSHPDAVEAVLVTHRVLLQLNGQRGQVVPESVPAVRPDVPPTADAVR